MMLIMGGLGAIVIIILGGIVSVLSHHHSQALHVILRYVQSVPLVCCHCALDIIQSILSVNQSKHSQNADIHQGGPGLKSKSGGLDSRDPGSG